MYSYLSGEAVSADTLLVGGVGFLVQTADGLKPGERYNLSIRTVVRDSDISLYGFISPVDRDIFDALVKVSGVGAKMALGILGLGAAAVARAIRSDDAAALAKAPGIGVKKAAAIIGQVALPATCDLLGSDAEGGPHSTRQGAARALVAMGFGESEADAAVRAVPAELDEGRLLRQALLSLTH